MFASDIYDNLYRPTLRFALIPPYYSEYADNTPSNISSPNLQQVIQQITKTFVLPSFLQTAICTFIILYAGYVKQIRCNYCETGLIS